MAARGGHAISSVTRPAEGRRTEHEHPAENVPLAPLTTFRLGGEARFLWRCRGVDEVVRALRFARERDLPVQVLGEGSNTIFPDEGFPGLVLKVELEGFSFRPAATGVEVRAAAGVHWDDLVRASVERGLTGIECLSGIPGAVGAAPIQNVGAYGQELVDTLIDVWCLERESLERVRIGARDCGFGYRWSRFKGEDRGRFVILGVRLRLEADTVPELRYPELEEAVGGARRLGRMSPEAAVRKVRSTVLRLRRSKSMVIRADDPNSRSAGSFFLNPVLSPEEFRDVEQRWEETGDGGPIPSYPAEGGMKVPAAWLVERAGFHKGYRHGGVAISDRHALALVNRDGTAAELLELGSRIRESVRRRFGVTLEREPVLARPEGNDPAC